MAMPPRQLFEALCLDFKVLDRACSAAQHVFDHEQLPTAGGGLCEGHWVIARDFMRGVEGWQTLPMPQLSWFHEATVAVHCASASKVMIGATCMCCATARN